jgi:methylenetetrahydrofolate dehydrogenase (NADP+)/methenyltetrahydrofolate cyclohydrolase
MVATRLIDGRVAAAALRARVAAAATALTSRQRVVPGLAAVLLGADPASDVYIRSKAKATREVGLDSVEHRLPAATAEAELLDLIAGLNADPAIDGILVQLPLPVQIDPQRVIEAIDPEKDVDGFHPRNVARLWSGGSGLVPCTPHGCLILLRAALGALAGADAVVIGRSNIVGKPMAQLLLRENCTVTIAHSRTKNLPDVVRRADLVVAAIGKPEFVKGDWIKPGAIVIDVGINRIVKPDGKGKLVGDVAFAEAAAVAGAITPVPGGVGPMTIACLLKNTVEAAQMQRGIAAAA